MHLKELGCYGVIGLFCLVCLAGTQSPIAEAQSNAQLRRYGDLHIGKKMDQWCFKRLGKRIGKGECTDMIAAALEASGGEPGDFSKDPYVWGILIKQTGKPKPGTKGYTSSGRALPEEGEIVQFENCVFVNGNYTSNLGAPRHTALVHFTSGTRVHLIQQNAPIGSGIKEQTVDFNGLKSGRYYRYVPRPKA